MNEGSVQRDVFFFLENEGDAWFRRNTVHVDAPSEMRQVFARRIAANLFGTRPRVFEIGAAEGANLTLLKSVLDIEAHGIEPSAQAVEVGARIDPDLSLRTGSADHLPYDAGSFDAVWFGFCLYLVDRALLFRAVAEADRVLRAGGLLAIVDFDPEAPFRRAYHHRSGLWSYKMDYSRLFLANPAYRLIEKASASYAGLGWVENPQDRISLWLCRKDTANAYREFAS